MTGSCQFSRSCDESGLQGKCSALSIKDFFPDCMALTDERLKNIIGAISRTHCSNPDLWFAPPVNTESETAVVNVTYSNREQTRQ